MAELQLALAATEEQCAAGDSRALVRRAHAHRLLRDFPAAARDLDAFLALHSLADEEDEHRQFLTGLQDELATTVARITIRTHLTGVTLNTTNGAVGDPPSLHYTPIGRVRLEITAPGYETVSTILGLTAGPHTLTVDEPAAPFASAPGELPHVTLRAILPIAATPPPAGAAPHLAAQPAPPTGHTLRPWIVPTAITAGAFTALGISFTAWGAIERSSYDDLRCVNVASADCRDRFDRIGTARALEVTSFVLAGAFAVGALTLWLVDRRAAPAAASATRGCAPLINGVRCAF